MEVIIKEYVEKKIRVKPEFMISNGKITLVVVSEWDSESKKFAGQVIKSHFYKPGLYSNAWSKCDFKPWYGKVTIKAPREDSKSE